MGRTSNLVLGLACLVLAAAAVADEAPLPAEGTRVRVTAPQLRLKRATGTLARAGERRPDARPGRRGEPARGVLSRRRQSFLTSTLERRPLWS